MATGMTLLTGLAISHEGFARQTSQPPATSPLWCTWQPGPSTAGPGAGKTIVLISGDEEYRSEEALPMLGKLFCDRLGFTCHCLFAIDPETGVINPKNQNNIPGMQLLENADLVVMALRFRNLPDGQMRYFDEYLKSGKPLLALRTSTHAFNYPDDSDSVYRHYSFNSGKWEGGFGRQVLGETWVSHHGNHGSQSTRGVPHEGASKHIVLTGAEDVWGPTDVYGVRNLPDGTTILLDGQVLDGMQPESQPVAGKQNQPMMPLAWIREYPNANGKVTKVFCTTMGAATDFESGGLRRLVVNAALYLTGRELAIENVSDVEPAAPYHPTGFGFDRFRPGLKPADYQ
jgi:hypothetical protein